MTLLFVLLCILSYPIAGGITLALCAALPPRKVFSSGEAAIIVMAWPVMLAIFAFGVLVGLGMSVARLFRAGVR